VPPLRLKNEAAGRGGAGRVGGGVLDVLEQHRLRSGAHELVGLAHHGLGHGGDVVLLR
jgi:hypothetical protein